MHFQILGEGTANAMAAVATKLDVDIVAQSLGTKLQGVEFVPDQMVRNPKDVEFHRFPVKSEVWVALTNGASAYCFGELWPPMHGSTIKTRLKDSLFLSEIRDLQKEFCGDENYWRYPEFRGKVINGQWNSPYTEAFTAQHGVHLVEKVMWLALYDLLSGMMDLDREGYSELSEQQIVRGVNGSFINAMNLKSSVGPPFNSSKRNFFILDEESTWVSPDVINMYDKLLDQSKVAIPAAFGICTLKDEPLKPGKTPRVFTCMPAAYNMMLQGDFGPIKAFMRANFQFFESAVGIDMTGDDVMKLITLLKRVNPQLDTMYEEDGRKLDKSYNGVIWDFIALFFYAVAWSLNLDCGRVFNLIHGLKHTRFAIKGDVFSCWWNPSGCAITVELNGVFMSLGHRYVYYLDKIHLFDDLKLSSWISEFFTRPIPPYFCGFRSEVALATYGDDVVMNWPNFNIANYCDIWLYHLGVELTDGDKQKNLVRRDITGVQFLKRRFVWDDEVGRYLTPLDIKSLIRTLVIKKDSELSSPDHAAVAITEVLRELVYHGETMYNKFYTKFEPIVTFYHLQHNGYLNFKPYAYWRAKLLLGNFSSWVPRSYVNEDPGF
jgi:hypothetical protein